MRCGVGHLSRKIKISGTSEDGLGGTLFVYHWIKVDSENPEKEVD